MKTFFYDSCVIHFYSFMFWNKLDHKKYGFALVLYIFWDISSFNSEKGDSIKLSRTGLFCEQERKMFVPQNCKEFILKRNVKFLEFWFSYQSYRNAIVF